MERVYLWSETEYTYPLAFEFRPHIRTYLHPDPTVRPAVLICPGGAYNAVCPSEAQAIAEMFYRKGYQAFVLVYTTDVTSTAPLRLQPMQDASRAIRLLRSKAAEFRIDPKRLAVSGFSAGGHLAACMCVHFADLSDPNPELARYSNRPDAAILGYAVLDFGEYAHAGTVLALLGEQPGQTERDYMSPCKNVTKDTPPCFIWHTAQDEYVPVEGSYRFAEACRRAGVAYAHHVFCTGPHGLSLANDMWIHRQWEDQDTLEQVDILVKRIRAGKQGYNSKSAMLQGFLDHPTILDTLRYSFSPATHPNAEVAVWPELVEPWLESVMPQKGDVLYGTCPKIL